MSEQYRKRAKMQPGEEPPVIKNPNKPAMDEGRAVPRVAGDERPYMPADLPAAGTGEDGTPTPGEPPEQVGALPPQQARATEAGQERYVRMRVRVRGDQMEVVDAWLVDSPLARPERLHPGLVYEVAIGGKQVSFGSIPDVGVRRSFPPEEPSDEIKGHHIEEVPSYEFAVRIPQRALAAESLPGLRISVYRIKGAPPSERALRMPLLEQFPQELRPVAELRGIRLEDLPKRVQEELRRTPEP